MQKNVAKQKLSPKEYYKGSNNIGFFPKWCTYIILKLFNPCCSGHKAFTLCNHNYSFPTKKVKDHLHLLIHLKTLIPYVTPKQIATSHFFVLLRTVQTSQQAYISFFVLFLF